MREKGNVRFIDRDRGYGFIVGEDGNRDRFFHWTGSPDWQKLALDQRVTFQIGTGADGRPRAVDVRCVG